MGAGSSSKRRRSASDTHFSTPSRTKPSGSGRRGRPPNAPRDGRERPPPLTECFRKRCTDVLDRLKKKDHYNIFLEPVNTETVTGYLDIIKHPMDFSTMTKKLSRQEYKSLGEFRKDLDLIWSNCLLFNGKEPTNIFSKKAIELRRLTEKLIVTTRQYLERDKDNLIKWKEKHRRRKENMATKSGERSVLHAQTIPNSSLLSTRTPRRDLLDTNANEVNEDQNGRTPEQLALAESLRSQYSGTTGLFRESNLKAPLPRYTKPDGSVETIRVRRYYPEDDHWGLTDTATALPVPRSTQCPPLLCDSLPAPPSGNPCKPRLGLSSTRVHDYAESLVGFFKGTGMEEIGNLIAMELLRPELEVKKKQDELVKNGYNLKDLESKARNRRPRQQQAKTAPPKLNWDTSAIIKLVDDIESANRRNISSLPKLSRKFYDLEGIDGLERILGKQLAKEVDEVPREVVDFNMPHGTSLATISDVCRLAQVPALKMTPTDLQSIERLRQVGEKYMRGLTPQAVARMRQSPVSQRQSNELHDFQMQAKIKKVNWRREAERQSQKIQQKLRMAYLRTLPPQSKSEGMLPIRQRDADTSASRIQHAQGVPARKASPSSRIAPKKFISKARQDAATAELERGIIMALNERPTNSKNAPGRNYGAQEVADWKRIPNASKESFSMPSGLHMQRNQAQRPGEQIARMMQRNGVQGGMPNGRGPVSGAPLSYQQVHSSHLIPNGISQRSIPTAERPGQHQVRHPSPQAPLTRASQNQIPPGVSPYTRGRSLQSIKPAGQLGSSYLVPGQHVNNQVTTSRTKSPGNASMDPRIVDPTKTMAGQTQHQVQSFNKLTNFNNGAQVGVATGSVHPHMQGGVPQMFYRGHPQHAPVGMTSQQLLALAAAPAQTGLSAMQRQRLLQSQQFARQFAGSHLSRQSGVPGLTPQSTQIQPGAYNGAANGSVNPQAVNRMQRQQVLNSTLARGQPAVPAQSTGHQQSHHRPGHENNLTLQGTHTQANLQGQGWLGPTHASSQMKNQVAASGNGPAVVQRTSQAASRQENLGSAKQGVVASLPDEIGIGDIPSFMENGGSNNGVIPNFGETGNQNAFGNNVGGNSDGMGTDQMEDITDALFSDSGIDGPPGATDFRF